MPRRPDITDIQTSISLWEEEGMTVAVSPLTGDNFISINFQTTSPHTDVPRSVVTLLMPIKLANLLEMHLRGILYPQDRPHLVFEPAPPSFT